MAKRLADKIAIVTGGAHGIGGAIADRLAADGAKVLVADVEESAARSRASEIMSAGGEALALSVDVRERAQTKAMVDRAVEQWGRVDILVSNAGIVDRQPFLEMDDDLWNRVLATNLYGAFTSGQHAARQMVAQGGGGRIVHVASNSGIFGGRGRAAYGASKAGLINLTQTMAIELAEHGILVNAVAPGATRTRVTSGDHPPETVMARMPLRRYGEPSEIAAVAAFLASDECSFTTGHVFCADGGFTVAGVMEG
ncbi:MAG: glucose 1-dehydrogenase [Alphaproteobacteria bacterium]|nr:glucose 1-dehydrogenase [Alphaproteobacteria bacterium]